MISEGLNNVKEILIHKNQTNKALSVNNFWTMYLETLLLEIFSVDSRGSQALIWWTKR